MPTHEEAAAELRRVEIRYGARQATLAEVAAARDALAATPPTPPAATPTSGPERIRAMTPAQQRELGASASSGDLRGASPAARSSTHP